MMPEDRCSLAQVHLVVLVVPRRLLGFWTDASSVLLPMMLGSSWLSSSFSSDFLCLDLSPSLLSAEEGGHHHSQAFSRGTPGSAQERKH